MSDPFNELRKYVVQGSVNEELIREQSEGYQPKPLPEGTEIVPPKGGTGVVNPMRNESKDYAIRKMIAEAIMGEMAEGPYNPDANCPDYIRKSQKLLQLIQDLIWRLRDSYKTPYPGEEQDDFSDLKELMASTVKPTIKLAIVKLHDIWMREADEQFKKDDVAATVKITSVEPGDQVVSPQGIEYSVEKVAAEGKVVLRGVDGNISTIEESALKTGKWRKK